MIMGVFSGITFFIKLSIRIFLGKFHHTLLAVRMIFPARKMYFKRNVLICCRYSVSPAKSILNSKNKL